MIIIPNITCGYFVVIGRCFNYDQSGPGSHSRISRYKIFAKGWVAQKPFVL